MKYYTEDNLNYYSKALSETEDLKCSRTIKSIKKVLNEFKLVESTNGTILSEEWRISNGYSSTFSNNDLRITLLLQGSYANKTCVRKESDVDIALIIENPFYAKLAKGKSNRDYGFIDNDSFNFHEFKNELVIKLQNEFGYGNVENHNKSIKIKGDNNRKDADVVPCLIYRNYEFKNSINVSDYVKGISIPTNDGNFVINYPEEHIKNGREKNNRTSRMFKRIVRMLKRINYDLQEEGLFRDEISSFGIECCVYNVSDSYFTRYNLYKDVLKDVLASLINNYSNYESFVEVNEVFYVFKHDTQKSPEKYLEFFKEAYIRL